MTGEPTLSAREREWLRAMPAWFDVNGRMLTAKFDNLVEQLETTFTERETWCIACVLEPNLYPIEGEDFTDIINEALQAVRRVMNSKPTSEPSDEMDTRIIGNQIPGAGQEGC